MGWDGIGILQLCVPTASTGVKLPTHPAGAGQLLGPLSGSLRPGFRLSSAAAEAGEGSLGVAEPLML